MTLPRVYPESVGTFQLTSGHSYTIGPDSCQAAIIMARTEPWVAIDIETAGLGELAMDIKCVTIGTASHAIILDPRDSWQAMAIVTALETAKTIVLHNAPYDVPLLVRNGLMRVEDIAKVQDTLLYARYAEPDERTRKGLDDCAQRYLGTTPGNGVLAKAFKAAGLTKTAGFREFDIDRPIYVFGAAEDVLTTAALYPLVMKAAIKRLVTHPFGDRGVTGQELLRLLNREQKINRMHMRRAAKGFLVDYEFLDDYRSTNQASISKDSQDLEGLGIKTPASLIAWLEAADCLPVDHPRTPTGKWSTAADSLERLDHTVANMYKRHKDLVKVDRDYLQKCVDLSGFDGRVHPTTNILGAQTGRESMNTPPLHQFPPGARGIILAEPGDSMVSIDWRQIEPVLMANQARDYPMLDAFEQGEGDFYAAVGEAAGIPRKHAKVVVLGTLYGMGHGKLCHDLGVGDVEGYRIRETVFAPIPRVAALAKRIKVIGDVHAMIFTLSGRIVPVDPRATYRAINYNCQGGAYDLLAEAMLAVEEAGLGDALYWAMHDELVVSKDAAHDVRRIMETPPARLIDMAGRVPVLKTDMLELGERWAEA